MEKLLPHTQNWHQLCYINTECFQFIHVPSWNVNYKLPPIRNFLYSIAANRGKWKEINIKYSHYNICFGSWAWDLKLNIYYFFHILILFWLRLFTWLGELNLYFYNLKILRGDDFIEIPVSHRLFSWKSKKFPSEFLEFHTCSSCLYCIIVIFTYNFHIQLL